MVDNVFINEFLSTGFEYYFNKSGNSIFEGHIVECLCDIYGYDALKQIYETKNEGAFIDLIRSYGFAVSLYDSFIGNTVKYEQFKTAHTENPAIKTELTSKIEVSLITMYIYKCFLIEPTLEEISHFENNLLNNFEIIKLHFNISLEPNRTREVWSKKKRMLDDNVQLVKIVPTFLDDETYKKYGTSLQEVEKMDYRMVEELNSYIQSKQSLEIDKPEVKKEKFNLFANTALTSGSGYVDALLVASIIATAISSALIYIFLHS